MAHDDDHKPTDLSQIIASIDIPDSAHEPKLVPGRKAHADTGMRYQTLSDGQWYNSPTLRPNEVDDFTGDIITEGVHKIGEPTGPVPLVDDLIAARQTQQMEALSQPMTEAARLEAFKLSIRKQTQPERFKLRRNIDMTIHYPPKPKNDRDYREAMGKVAPSKQKLVKPPNRVPPRMRPKA